MDSYRETLQELVILLKQNDIKVTCAESCTGGTLAGALTEEPGSSNWFDMGFVTYSNQAKQILLGVSSQTLAKYGAVSEQTAYEMALGALNKANATYALSTTGIAGPDGGTEEKPVGTVCFALASRDEVRMYKQYFSGNRYEIRQQAVNFSLQLLRNALSK